MGEAGPCCEGFLGRQEVNYSCCWLVISGVGGTGWKMGVGDAPRDLRGSARGCPKNGNDRDTGGQKGSPGHLGRPQACIYRQAEAAIRTLLYSGRNHTQESYRANTRCSHTALTRGAHTRKLRTTSNLASALNRSEFSKQLPTIRTYGFPGS